MRQPKSRRTFLMIGAGAFAAPALATTSGRAHAADPTFPYEVNATDMVLGAADAPITIIEYASLTCDHCGAFHRNTLPQLKKAWIEPGKARLVYRDFPLNGPALQAAMLAHCAGRERYFGFLEVMFQQQEQWSHAKDPMAALAKLVRLGGMSEQQISACLSNKDVERRVLATRLDGEKRYAIRSTPTFLVNGRKITGNLPYAEFQKVLASAAGGA